MFTTKRSNQGLAKDYDDHGCKRQKTTMTSKSGEEATMMIMSPSSCPLDSVEIASKVFPFLQAQELLDFVSCHKDYSHREYLTYPLVLRSILLTGGRTKNKIDMALDYLNHAKNYDVPDPLGILKFACCQTSFGKTFHQKNRKRMVYATGEISRDYNDKNAKAIREAIKENRQSSLIRERWKRGKVDGILEQLAGMLGNHPCRRDILIRRRWDLWFYTFQNKFVDTTLECTLDLKNNPCSVTKKQLMETARDLWGYYHEHQRQSRILTCLDTLINRVGFCESCHKLIHLSRMANWGHFEKRFVFVQAEANNVLKQFLVNRDKAPAVVAEEIFQTIKESPIYSLAPPSRPPSRASEHDLYMGP